MINHPPSQGLVGWLEFNGTFNPLKILMPQWYLRNSWS